MASCSLFHYNLIMQSHLFPYFSSLEWKWTKILGTTLEPINFPPEGSTAWLLWLIPDIERNPSGSQTPTYWAKQATPVCAPLVGSAPHMSHGSHDMWLYRRPLTPFWAAGRWGLCVCEREGGMCFLYQKPLPMFKCAFYIYLQAQLGLQQGNNRCIESILSPV